MRFAYEDSRGRIYWLEQPFSAGPPPTEYETDDGVHVRRCYRAEQVGTPHPKGWPMTCFASGVNAAQAQELRDEFKRLGVPTEVTNDGDPIYTSPAHRRRALKARGMFDRSGYC